MAINDGSSAALAQAFGDIGMTEMEYHTFITSNRLMALSVGSPAITADTVAAASAFEKERKKRVAMIS